MLLFGLAEIATAFRHAFFGLSTQSSLGSTAAGAAIGLLYLSAGALALVGRRWALDAALVCLGLDVAGRLAMVGFGFFPFDSPRQVFGITVGTLVAIGFGVYLWSQRRRYG